MKLFHTMVGLALSSSQHSPLTKQYPKFISQPSSIFVAGMVGHPGGLSGDDEASMCF